MTLSFAQVLMDSLLLTAVFTLVVMGSLYLNPRLWLQDYPAEMRAKVPPLTRREKLAQYVLTALFVLACGGALAYAGSRLLIANGGTVSLLTAYVHIALMLNFVNLFDAVVLDYLLLARLKPRFAILPGTEGLEYLFDDLGMHWRNYLKGVMICSVLALPIALIIAF